VVRGKGAIMKYLSILALLVVSCLGAPSRAEHANIDLHIIRRDPATGSNKEDVTASALQEPPGENVKQRPQIKVKANEPLALQFILINTYPHGEKKDVTVRYFVVREAKLRQKEVPDLREGVVTQGRFTLNYKPKCRVGALQKFTIKEPGPYLLRVQTENTDSDHEHFSAIDILVEK
jgi:hypothetical protein